MPPPTQAGRSLAINTPLGADKVLLRSATVTEQMGRLFQIEVELSSTDRALSFDDVVGGNATIKLNMLDGAAPRYFNGYISRFAQIDAAPGDYTYHATLVPWLWFLTRTSDCRIFQNMTVPDIVKQVFSDQGFSDIKDSLSGTYTALENCVQYRETDFNFVSRLMEHEGIYYFFEHEDGKHTLVLADAASAHSAFTGYDSIAFRPDRGGMRDKEVIQSWTLEQEVQPGTYALNDFNFTKPATSLLAQSNITTNHAQSTFAMYDYPGEYGEQSAGSDYSKYRIEELHTQHEIVHGTTNARGISAGYTFSLTGAGRDDQNRSYLLTSASIHLVNDDYTSNDGSQVETYTCTFTAIDASKPFRAARVTPKPLIQGPQTAIVVGPSGEEIHTDEYGRVKLQFPWDRYGKADENASCWVRVSQAAWAGKGWGSLHLPRVGQEVIVEFLEGNPDLPIVTGNVYNAVTTVPYALPDNKTRTTLKSNSSKGGSGYNELRFEDKADSEQIFIHAQKNMDIYVENDRMETIVNDRHLQVNNNKFEKVSANRHEEVSTSHFEKIGTDHNLDIGGKQAVHVADSQSIGVDGNAIQEIGGDFSQKVTGKFYVTATGDLVIEGSASITIKVGGNSIAIGPDGIALKGTLIKIEADTTMDVKGAATTIAGSATADVKGPMVSLKGDAMATVKGGVVMIN